MIATREKQSASLDRSLLVRAGKQASYRVTERRKKYCTNSLDVIFNRHKKPIWDTMGHYRGTKGIICRSIYGAEEVLYLRGARSGLD